MSIHLTTTTKSGINIPEELIAWYSKEYQAYEAEARSYERLGLINAAESIRRINETLLETRLLARIQEMNLSALDDVQKGTDALAALFGAAK